MHISPTYSPLWQQIFMSTTERISGQVSMRNALIQMYARGVGDRHRGHKEQEGETGGRAGKNDKTSYFLIHESSSRSILFCTSAVGISPTSATTFSLQLEIASKDSLSVVENTSTQAWAPARSQRETRLAQTLDGSRWTNTEHTFKHSA